MTNFLKIILSIFVLEFLWSCVPKLPLQELQDASLYQKIKAPESFTEKNQTEFSEDLVQKDWHLFFQDQQLVSLIEIALKNNQELNIFEQEVQIANNEVLAKRGQYLPKVEIGASVAAEKTSENSPRGASDKVSGLSENLSLREMSLSASWEVDIWQKLRNFSKASYLEYLATVEGKKFLTTKIVSEVSSDYYELMSLDNQLEIIDQFLATLEEALNVADLQKAAGRTTSLPIKRFDAEILNSQSRKKTLEQKIVATENHLNFLLGRLPQHIERSSKNFVETELPKVALGIPAQMLQNRPDLKQASLQLEAKKLNVKAVRAQFYPSLNIGVETGYSSFNAKHFLDPSSLFYDAAAGVSLPLLNRSAIKAEYFSANNREIAAIYNYEQTFIKAFAEVVTQLAAVNNSKKIYDLRSQQSETLAEALEISNVLFKAARVDYLESLLTRRDYLESRLNVIEAKQQEIVASISLYRALGGGWRSQTDELQKI